jgi:hypothetical protein
MRHSTKPSTHPCLPFSLPFPFLFYDSRLLAIIPPLNLLLVYPGITSIPAYREQGHHLKLTRYTSYYYTS